MALLAIDVGNTQTVFGLFEGAELREHWRVATERSRTRRRARRAATATSSISRASTGSRSPRPCRSSHRAYEELRRRTTPRAELLELGPGVKTGVPISLRRSREVGPDRIANAVAAVERYGAAVHRGRLPAPRRTSTSSRRRGSTSAACSRPGSRSRWTRSSSALRGCSRSTSSSPPTVIAKNTAASLQSGLVYGFAGQVDGIVERIRGELGADAQTVATGGLADLIVPTRGPWIASTRS